MLTEGEPERYVQAKGFYANRAVGSDSDYSPFDVDNAAGNGQGEKTGKIAYMP